MQEEAWRFPSTGLRERKGERDATTGGRWRRLRRVSARTVTRRSFRIGRARTAGTTTGWRSFRTRRTRARPPAGLPAQDSSAFLIRLTSAFARFFSILARASRRVFSISTCGSGGIDASTEGEMLAFRRRRSISFNAQDFPNWPMKPATSTSRTHLRTSHTASSVTFGMVGEPSHRDKRVSRVRARSLLTCEIFPYRMVQGAM